MLIHPVPLPAHPILIFKYKGAFSRCFFLHLHIFLLLHPDLYNFCPSDIHLLKQDLVHSFVNQSQTYISITSASHVLRHMYLCTHGTPFYRDIVIFWTEHPQLYVCVFFVCWMMVCIQNFQFSPSGGLCC
jgi:hypothetical protein